MSVEDKVRCWSVRQVVQSCAWQCQKGHGAHRDVARGERTELLCLTSPMNQHNT